MNEPLTDDFLRKVRDRAAQDCAVIGAVDINRLLAEIDRLRGEVHDCPKCGRSCKQCQCMEEEMAQLRSQISTESERCAGIAERVSTNRERGCCSATARTIAERIRQTSGSVRGKL